MERLNSSPEEKLARKLLLKYNLTPPINMGELISTFAKLEYRPIPFEGIDGVSLGIKIPNKTPIVIVNTNIPKTRQLFTLAHELGHIVIPWHVGTMIPDNADNSSYWGMDFEYKQMEQEANRFAAALLMPSDWILNLSKTPTDLSSLHKTIHNVAKVSPLAAAIRLCATLSPNIIYIVEEDGVISITGKTLGTYQVMPENGKTFSKSFITKFDERSEWSAGNQTFHWWKLPHDLKIGNTRYSGDVDPSFRVMLTHPFKSILM